MPSPDTIKRDDRPALGGYAPGEHLNRCPHCGEHFMGDKRARSCADCAYADPPPAPPLPAVDGPHPLEDLARRWEQEAEAQFDIATAAGRLRYQGAKERAARAHGGHLIECASALRSALASAPRTYTEDEVRDALTGQEDADAELVRDFYDHGLREARAAVFSAPLVSLPGSTDTPNDASP